MEADVLDAVRGDDIEFASVRDPSSFERRIVVTAPPVLARLAASGDVGVLDGLVELLGDPERAWPAQVLLTAMTRREERPVEAFARDPGDWWSAAGEGAQARWGDWLRARREHLVWDEERAMFIDSAD